MDTIIKMLILLLIISFMMSGGYVIYMGTKRNQFPKVDFSRFNDDKRNVDGLETLVNNALNGVNGWMWLATLFMSVYYFLNFWSIAFLLLDIVIVAYEVPEYKDVILFLTAGSLMFTFLELWINSKEKSIHFHNQWFDTSATAKEYLAKFAAAEKYDDLCKLVEEFNNKIYNENKNVHFL